MTVTSYATACCMLSTLVLSAPMTAISTLDIDSLRAKGLSENSILATFHNPHPSPSAFTAGSLSSSLYDAEGDVRPGMQAGDAQQPAHGLYTGTDRMTASTLGYLSSLMGFGGLVGGMTAVDAANMDLPPTYRFRQLRRKRL